MTARRKNINIICLIFTLSVFFKLTAQISPGDLSAAHAQLEGIENCTQCHDAGGSTSKIGKTISDAKCLACHKPIARSRANKTGFHSSAGPMSKHCFQCHNEHHGRKFVINPLDTLHFNHDLTGFSLKGRHAKESCASCHNPQHIKDPAQRKIKGTLLGLDKKCASCHNDFHQGKMGNDCASCHTFDSFKNAKRFDHNKTHFALKGRHTTVSCAKCHKTVIKEGREVQNFDNLKFANCNACHKDPHENKFGQDCASCHQENSFKNVKKKDSFNHDITGYPLIGKHKTVDCNQCHKSGNLTKPIAHSNCYSCHADFHEGQFTKNGKQKDCSQCHTNEGFEIGTFGLEEHNKTHFQLKGAHAATACSECHLKEGKWKFKKLKENCIDCHKNEHEGKMDPKFMPEGNCAVCHNEENWKTVKFDHNQTNFKLEGKHMANTCADCHYPIDKDGVKKQRFNETPSDCSKCHQDTHAGQFEKDGKTDCKRCHTTDNWVATKFDHNQARFKLDGHHKDLACSRCHPEINTEKGTHIQHHFNDISCAACHK